MPPTAPPTQTAGRDARAAAVAAPRTGDHARAVAGQHVSGRYRSLDDGFEVELRVDVDGRRATNRLSADYFRRDKAQTTYVGSMRVDRPVVSSSASQVTITGDGVFTWPTRHKGVKITIPRASVGAPAVATLTHFAARGGAGARYVCAFECESFRTVSLVESAERSVVKFTTYDTGALPSGGPERCLSAVSAFAEAGIEAVQTQEVAEVDTSIAGDNASWSDAELHAAMELSFSRWMDHPQWAVWLLHAVLHEDPSVFGLMFDRQGLQRQGCAVFYHGLTPTTPELQRELLRVCVHEIGHAFNLPHSWQQTRGESALPSRPGACSWMNYPERFPGGTPAFWKEFAFEFDDAELVHLRHAFRDNVIMGGAPFVGSAASTDAGSWKARPRNGGLRLRLTAPSTLALGVPVTVGLELANMGRVPRIVPRVLGPRPSTVDISIRRPGGEEILFEPLLHHCRGQEQVTMTAGDPPIRDFAFIHYGRDGFSFDAPGVYKVRARHVAADGTVVVSNEVVICVRPPATRVEREVARLVVGNDEVGTLMSLMGSDARALRRGNDALRTIIERYPGHPVADIARIVHGANLARGFKLLDPDGDLSVRGPDTRRAAQLVGPVVDVTKLHRLPPGQHAAAIDIATRPRVDAVVHAFVNSRRSEINATVRARRPAPSPARHISHDPELRPSTETTQPERERTITHERR